MSFKAAFLRKEKINLKHIYKYINIINQSLTVFYYGLFLSMVLGDVLWGILVLCPYYL